jgi:hypothetical protein
MIFLDEIEFNGRIFITFKSLEVSGVVNLEALKHHVKEKNILAYRVSISDGSTIQKGIYPAVCRQPACEISIDVRPYLSRERDMEIIWIYTSYCKLDLEKFGLIPAADNTRKMGTANAVQESMERTIQAAYLVGKWIAESGNLPDEITKPLVQDILGQNDFGYGDTVLFNDVWKAIPHLEKNSGDRPPSLYKRL